MLSGTNESSVTSDLTKNLKSLINLRKIHQKFLQFLPETKLVFCDTIIRKDKNNLDKHWEDVNAIISVRRKVSV